MKSWILLAGSIMASFSSHAFELRHGEGALTDPATPRLELPATPKKIVTFDLGVLDTLHTLAIPVIGVPKSAYEGDLADFNKTTVVGTLFEPDYDVLKQLQPELIFAGGRSAKAIPELEKIAPTVSYTADPRAFLDSVRASAKAIGTAFGKEAQAQAALAKLDGTVEKLHAANKGKSGLFLFTINGNVMTHAPGDRFGYAYELSGLNSVLPPSDPNAPAQPRPEPGSEAAKAAAAKRAETLATALKADPDWLIVLDRGAINGGKKTAAETLAKHPEISQSRAFKEGRVYYADPNGWYVVTTGLANLQTITDDMLKAMK
ncbi:ABC transporter substrate-binding protein [Bordetella sp. 02P26C-1]|uniref:ABC transporter substrate-binding protein n=1 Tax=Bordetella sp. 02P26C-1 TaxID=2683195 RepID=UPI0030141DF3